MWAVLVEFHSVSSEGIADEEKKIERSAVKPKSVDDYVGGLVNDAFPFNAA